MGTKSWRKEIDMKKLRTWEESYKSVESLWGVKPDNELVRYASIVPEGKVLDLGIGEGRNALFFDFFKIIGNGRISEKNDG